MTEKWTKRPMFTVRTTANALKVTLVLDPEAFQGITVPNGEARSRIELSVGDRKLSAEVNSKSLRRAITAIDASEPDSFAVVLSGKLEGSAIMEAGIAVQPKAPKAAKPDSETAIASALAEIL